jgi:hypothetical protein
VRPAADAICYLLRYGPNALRDRFQYGGPTANWNNLPSDGQETVTAICNRHPCSGPADFLSAKYAYLLQHSNPIPERTKDQTLWRSHVDPSLDHSAFDALCRSASGRSEGTRYPCGHYCASRWTWAAAAKRLTQLLHMPILDRIAKAPPSCARPTGGKRGSTLYGIR